MPLFSFNYKKANGPRSKKVWLACWLACFSVLQVFSQTNREKWVDSVFQKLPFEAKIGQLIMMPVDASASDAERDKLLNLVSSYGIGGIVLTRGGPVSQQQFVQQLQAQSVVPLLVGLNAEEGLGSTLDSTLVYPQTLMLGAIQDDSLLFYFGDEVGRQLKTLGVHVTFAPTADLSTTFKTDELVNHTFGENPARVANAAVLYMKGLQHAGIIPVAKHYPHYGLKVTGYAKGVPIMGLAHDDKQSLYPLKQLIDQGCPAILSSYIHDPIFPDRRKIARKKKRIIPEALPTLYTADYLKKNFNFQGLVFSYVPDVKVLLKKYQPGDSEIYAFLAGNDVLLFPQNIAATVRKLRRQIKKNPLLEAQLDQRVKKVLAFKYDAGLPTAVPQEQDNLYDKLNTLEARVLRRDLYEKSVSVVYDNQELLPIKILENTTFASLSVGERKENEFSAYLSRYAPFDHFQFHQPGEDTTTLLEELKKYDVVIAGIFLTSSGIISEYPALLDALAKHTKVVVCNFGPPSKLSLFTEPAAIVQAFVDDALIRRTVPQIIFGGLEGSGKLPLTINEKIREGSGVLTPSLGRLSYALPESVGMSSQTLEKISTLVREAIETQATPGCQVLIAKNGKVIYDQSFGWLTYDNQQPVTGETIYDLASMTKVLGTLQSVMFLYDRGLIDVNRKVSYYLPELRSTNKKDITLKDVLAHQAGLLAFIPLWPQTMKNEKEFLPYYYNAKRTEKYSLQVSPNVYAAPVIRDSLWKWTFESRMIEKPARIPYTLRYSDIGFWLLHRLSEKMLNQPMDDFLWQNLYEPIGAYTTGYTPLSRFPVSRIAPTEYDKIFRKDMIHGTVHDERAAMMGGVAGHAGLFSTAQDVAKLGQMLLQKGYYGGHQYLKPETVELFTAKQFETSRRGLGWDKPLQSDWATPTSLFSSPRTFGHTGFTGTCIWIDPEFELVYIFLSNRVYPDRSTKLITANIRSRIQDVIYQSIFDYCPYPNPFLWSRSR
ncbi:MAG TPA: serine hydrolase [Cyclobacteriaceae bacterium]|nr:serine hydrolase [Cyclobacteriaceae bacterium]HRJ81374.1 serine hydrolase [Cyclobacteriaceae bacterium]